ncbi:MAG: hypothetical protein IT379_11820 [Deltaproteobacteria bacterium]|nr:hypothetical protein [Deltaproteobacteria bacterium]
MTLELNGDAKKELDRLQELTGAASNAEVIRRSLAVYMALVEQAQRGFRRAELINAEGERHEILLVP